MRSGQDARWQSVTVRAHRYPNSVVAQDHRTIEQRCAWMIRLGLLS
jgi:hypothetical protein